MIKINLTRPNIALIQVLHLGTLQSVIEGGGNKRGVGKKSEIKLLGGYNNRGGVEKLT